MSVKTWQIKNKSSSYKNYQNKYEKKSKTSKIITKKNVCSRGQPINM